MRAWYAQHTAERVALLAAMVVAISTGGTWASDQPAAGAADVGASAAGPADVSATPAEPKTAITVPWPVQSWDNAAVFYDANLFPDLEPAMVLPGEERFEPELEFKDGSLRASDCCPVGGWVGIFPVSNFFQGNIVGVNAESVLSEIRAELDFTGSVVITYGVYRLDRSVNQYKPIKIVEVSHQGVGRAFYSSGFLNIALMPDGPSFEGRYALGVGWKDPVIDFGRDADSTFCAGTVVGWWGINANPPPETSTTPLSLSPSTGVAASMQVCFQAPGGACCLDDASCVDDVTSTGCVALGGQYNGDFSICALIPPCIGRGACCSGPGNCTRTTAAACGGTYKGDGTQCGSPDPCSTALGACCFYDGSCQQLNQYDCVESPVRDVPGTFTAPGVTCGSASCPVLGACCTSFDVCTDTTAANCVEFNCQDASAAGTCSGDFIIDTTGLCAGTGVNPEDCIRMTGLTYHQGEPCLLDACFGPVGTCCTLGECEAESQLVCENQGGIFTPAGADGWHACEVAPPDLCTSPGMGGDHGACCLPDGSCELASEADCAASAGVFQGVGVACSSFLCTDGACCYSDGGVPACAEILPVACAAPPPDGLGGTFKGSGTACPADCFPVGACCLPDGECVGSVGEGDCIGMGGTFQGEATSCSGLVCPIQGSCCVQFSAITLCFEETDAACAARIGTPGVISATFTAGGACVANACKSGACCELAGGCSITTGTECSTIPDSQFTVNVTTCEADTCPVLGACCTDSGCVHATRDACTSGLNGVYRGDGVSCSTADICTRAGCCLETGGCADKFIQDCVASNGLPASAGVMCGSDPDLCTPGACCIDFGSGTFTCFDDLNQFQCASFDIDFSSAFAGPNSSCASDPCTALTGSCCHLDGSCDAGATAGSCAAFGGATYTPGGTCVPNTCVDKCAAFPGLPPSDFNGDGRVDLVDYAALQRCFGASPGDECMCSFDVDEDGAITVDPDYNDFVTHFVGPVDLGACCHLNGVCDANVAASACPTAGGAVYTVGASCTPNPCVDHCAAYPGNPPGDFDGDDDIDLQDFSAFQGCFGGAPTEQCLCLFDGNENGAIELSDFAVFATFLLGP